MTVTPQTKTREICKNYMVRWGIVFQMPGVEVGHSVIYYRVNMGIFRHLGLELLESAT